MADAREETALLDDGGRAGIFDIGPRGQELQRNFAIESSVPGTVHVPEGTTTNWLQDTDVPPDLRRTCRCHTLLPVKVGELRQQVEFFDQGTLGVVGGRLKCPPIDGCAVENGAREFVRGEIARVHASFPPRDARARAAPPCAPRPHSVCPASPPALHSCSPTRRAR